MSLAVLVFYLQGVPLQNVRPHIEVLIPFLPAPDVSQFIPMGVKRQARGSPSSTTRALTISTTIGCWAGVIYGVTRSFLKALAGLGSR